MVERGLKGVPAGKEGDREGSEAEEERVKEEVLYLGVGFGRTEGGATPSKEGTENDRTPPVGRLLELWRVIVWGRAGFTGLPGCPRPRNPGA